MPRPDTPQEDSYNTFPETTPMNIARLLQRSASLYPDRPALRVGAQPWLTYGQLGARVAALAAHLRQQGIGPGDRVALYAANVREYLEALHAVYWAGAVTVPVNYKLHARELEYVLHDSGAALLLVSPELAPAATPVAPPARRCWYWAHPPTNRPCTSPPCRCRSAHRTTWPRSFTPRAPRAGPRA